MRNTAPPGGVMPPDAGRDGDWQVHADAPGVRVSAIEAGELLQHRAGRATPM
jgi:hypothetical protein